ncbi:thrombospondin type 3 repeat-containing protein [Pontiella sulfatireligans]|uniref:Alginate lyase domain-containing protein n=1 Tax=Pontiella sulfatireligans TaxID=2750658 RepID=A0A6C2UNV2_9BACT|nr:thrombospondin type 3 repeat-containing protein [Pontiella sulfatireligans]VGO21935.1 hypothetical protein SCARR_04015 [Pontiella sulfatireligans]
MSSKRFRSGTASVISFVFFAAIPSLGLADDHFAERARTVVEAVAAETIDWNSENSFKNAGNYANACFATGDDTSGQAILNQLIDKGPLNDSFFIDPEFTLFSVIACYARWQPEGKIPTDLDKRIHDYVTSASGDEDGTGTFNQRWMRCAGLMLANQFWPGEISWQFKSADPDGSTYFQSEIDEMVRTGHDEYNSATYMQYSTGPIQALADFHTDPDVSQKARMTMDWILVYLGSHYFHGHSGDTTLRSYYPFRKANGYPSLAGLYFGGPLRQSNAIVVHALSPYRPPQSVKNLAWAKDTAFTRLGSSSEDGQNKEERHVGYFNQDYVLFSHYDVAPQVQDFRSQAFRGGVRWKASEDEESTFYITHPKPRLQDDGSWRDIELGASERQAVLQNGAAQIGVFDVSDDTTDVYQLAKYWLLRTPSGSTLEASIDYSSSTGRIYLHYGSVMIGFYLTHNFNFSPGNQNKLTHNMTFSNGNYRAGYVIETALPSDYSGSTPAAQLAAFRTAADAQFDAALLEVTNDDPVFTYTSVGGDVLKLQYQEPTTYGSFVASASSLRWINGTELEINNDSDWPLMQSPYVYQENNDTRLDLDLAGRHITWDFADWSRTCSNDAWTGIDDFEEYSIDQDLVSAGTGWEVYTGTGNAPDVRAKTDPDDVSNQVMQLSELAGANYGAVHGHFLDIDNGETATLFFRMRSTAPDGVDQSAPIGVADDDTGTFYNTDLAFKLQGSNIENSMGTDAAANLDPRIWYNAWMVIHNDSVSGEETFELFLQSDESTHYKKQTRVGGPLYSFGIKNYGAQGAPNPIDTLIFSAYSADYPLFIDDIYYDDLGENLDLPEPLTRDRDEDGLLDAWEERCFGNLTTSDGGENDYDADGLPDLEEFRANTHPARFDTDGDGFSDGIEVLDGTDPVDASDIALQRIIIQDDFSGGSILSNTSYGAYAKDYDPENPASTVWYGVDNANVDYVWDPGTNGGLSVTRTGEQILNSTFIYADAGAASDSPFASQSLKDFPAGTYLSFSVDATISAAPATTGDLRIGLFDSNGTFKPGESTGANPAECRDDDGCFLALSTGGTNTAFLREHNLSGAFGQRPTLQGGSFTSLRDFTEGLSDDVPTQIELRIYRSTNGLVVAGYLDDIAVAVSDEITAPLSYRFDILYIAQSSTAPTFRIDQAVFRRETADPSSIPDPYVVPVEIDWIAPFDPQESHLNLQVDGLLIGRQYHLERSFDLSDGFEDIPDSSFTATDECPLLDIPADEDGHTACFIRIVEGAETP